MKSLLTRSSAAPFFGVVMLLLVLSCNGHSPTEPLAQPQPPAATGFVSGTVAVRIRASKQGYRSSEETFLPTNFVAGQYYITLKEE
jgi:hypothetical protein